MSWQEFHLERHIFSSNADTRAHFARVVRRVAQNETGRTFGECHFRDVIFKSASRHTRSGGTQVELGQELSAVLRPAAAAHSQGVAAIWREARFLHIATEQCCKFPDSGLLSKVPDGRNRWCDTCSRLPNWAIPDLFAPPSRLSLPKLNTSHEVLRY